MHTSLQTGADIVHDLTLNDMQTLKMALERYHISRFVTCDACALLGSQHKAEATTCLPATERAIIDINLSSIFGVGKFRVDCPGVKALDTLYRTSTTFVVVLDVFVCESEIMVDVPANSHDGDISEYLEWEMQEQIVLQLVILS